MTNYDYIKNLPKEKLAEFLVYSKTEERYEYDWEEEPYFNGLNTYWFHPFCNYCFDTKKETIEDCIKCLDKKFKRIYNDK